ncbi:MAG: DUF6082 family protein [Phycisphaerales bacterium]|jgi:hypothetical protein
MTSHLQIILQAISSVAICFSLIFAGLQLLHWRRAYQVANFTKLVELQMSLRKMRVDDPSLAIVHRHDVEGLESDEEIRHYFLNLMQLSVFEIAWYSFRQGQLTEDYFRSWEKRMRALLAEPSFRRMMHKPSMKILHDDFATYIEKNLRDVPERTADAPK